MSVKLKILKNNSISRNTFVSSIDFFDLKKIARLSVRGGDGKKYYQRKIDDDKINKIVRYIEEMVFEENDISKLKDVNDVITLFPSALILAFDANIINQDEVVDESEVTLVSSTLDDYYLVFPEKIEEGDEPALIVDGQHRYVGVDKFFKKYPQLRNVIKIEFPVSILINYDIYQQAAVFANVNFNQKQVNRSLYFDIFGEMPDEKNDITFAHFLTKYLNEELDSPFNSLIKMLGNEKNGIVTQAFLGESILPLLKVNGVFNEQFLNYKNGKNSKEVFEEVLSIIKDFFNIVKETFIEFYPVKNNDGVYVRNQYKHILFKTTGLGAFFRLLNYLGADNELNRAYINYLKSENIFSDDNYSKGAGRGMQSDLYNKMKYIIDYKKDVIGKKYDNYEIVDIKFKEVNGRKMHEIFISNGTRNIISDDDLEKIKLN